MSQNNLLSSFIEDCLSAPLGEMDICGTGNLIQSYPYSDEEALFSDMVAVGEDLDRALQS